MDPIAPRLNEHSSGRTCRATARGGATHRQRVDYRPRGTGLPILAQAVCPDDPFAAYPLVKVWQLLQSSFLSVTCLS